MFRFHVVWAVFKRNVLSYFSGLLGYLFIIVFVMAASFCSFQDTFFTDNSPTFDHLTEMFPYLLLFIVPAITMSTWADEKKSGTDELLFTLPGSDTEILIGKYLAVAAIYTVALVFSMTQLRILGWLGDPDWGAIGTTYFGYWVSGVSLLAAGMLASVLTNSTPVAFVLGAVFCAVPVFIGWVDQSNELLQQFSVARNLRDFSVGLIPFQNVMYFIAFGGVMLYLNFVVITRRHWGAGQRANMGLQFCVRAVCVAATLISLTLIIGYAATPVDFSAEKLFTISQTTEKVIGDINEDRPVTIQAFISPEVPQQYLETRKTLISLLDRYQEMGAGRLTVRRVDVEPYSEEAEEAQNLGIETVPLPQVVAGRSTTIDVVMGAIVSSPSDQVVIPFLGKGLPVEYELTRAIGTVSQQERLKVGILMTDAEIVQDDAANRDREWQLTRALRMNYDVVPVKIPAQTDAEYADYHINKDEEGNERFDVLLAVMPSSLVEHEMTKLVEYVETGAPILIFDDPLPYVFVRSLGFGRMGTTVAPALDKPSPGGGGMNMMMMGGNRPQAPPKADGGKLTSLLDVLQINWQYDEIVWDPFNPHLEFNLSGELVFVTPQSGISNAFSQDSPITSGMQEVLTYYTGSIQQRGRMSEGRTVEPLLMTGQEAVLVDWDTFTSPTVDFSSGSRAVSLKQISNVALFHAELSLENDPRQLVLRIYKADKQSPLAVEAGDVALELDADEDSGDEKKSKLLTLTPEPRTDESEDRCSVFVVKGDDLPDDVTDVAQLKGAVKVRIGRGSYRGRIQPATANTRGPNEGSLISMTAARSQALAVRVKEKGKVNAVFVADIDMISDWFFLQRERGDLPLEFDNVSFVMNAIDVLAGDETYVELRKRRAKLRTLSYLQRQRDQFIIQRNEEGRIADAEAEAQVEAAQKSFDEQRKKIENNTELSESDKTRLLLDLKQVEERKLAVVRANSEFENKKKLREIELKKERSIRELENGAQAKALIVSPLPAIILGLAMLMLMLISEKRTVTPERRAK